MTKIAPVGVAKPVHEESYDEWFIRQVEEALVKADDPNTVWVSHEEVERRWIIRRQEILDSIKSKAAANDPDMASDGIRRTAVTT